MKTESINNCTQAFAVQLVKRKRRASLINATDADLPGFIKLINACLTTRRRLMVIITSSLSNTPIERIEEIKNGISQMNNKPGFVVIDHIDDLLNDANDKQEIAAVMGLAKSWAGELGIHISVLNRQIKN